jgi:cyclophilin family peptidyl-prolyl cis-trans isomerase
MTVKIEQLEARRLMSAAVTAALPSVSSDTQFVALGEHFGDSNTYVRFSLVNGLNLGTQTIDLKLYDQNTPLTVQNFLNYVNRGLYDGAFFYRSLPGFIIQAGAFNIASPVTQIGTDATVPNEFATDVTHTGEVNVRGTIAMAKVPPVDGSGNPISGGGADSASADFFFNLADNASNLDNQNSGFTTFGEVVGNTITTVDAIAAAPVFDLSASTPFSTLPAVNVVNNTVALSNLVTINTARVIPLSYSAVSDNPGLVSVSVSGGALALSYPGSGSGTAHIMVTATSFDGSTATSTFTVTRPAGVVADLTAPTAVAFEPVLKADDSSFTFQVAYHDNVALNVTTLGNGGITVTGPGGFSQAATFVSAAAQANGETIATYQVTPAGAFVHGQSGSFVVNVNSAQVSDAAGNPMSAGAIGMLKLSFPDRVTPTAKASAGNLANGALTFHVSYHDDVAMLASTIDSHDVTVSGPGVSGTATLVTTSTAPDGTVVATYSIPATQVGKYVVTLLSNQVSDTSGNIIPGAAIGAVAGGDTAAPTALAANPVVTADNNSFTFAVTYSDDVAIDVSTLSTGDVTVNGPGFSGTATLVSFVEQGSGAVATYRAASVGGAFTPQQSGQFIVTVAAGEVLDLAGNAVAAGASGTLNVTIPDITPPTAAISRSPVVADGNASLSFDVQYGDNVAINTGTLDNLDISVSGPGFTSAATLVGFTTTNGLITATYQVTPTGHTFLPAQSGQYTITLGSGQVTDTSALPVPGGSMGSFLINFPTPLAPTATASNATIVAVNQSMTFSVLYHSQAGLDLATLGDDDLTVTGNSFSMGAHLVSTGMVNGNLAVMATYSVTPSSAFRAGQSGNFSVLVNSGKVLDIAGTPADPFTIGIFNFSFPDQIAPTATVGAATVASGNSFFTFTINYNDDFAINAATVGSAGVTMTGPGGFSAHPQFVSSSGTGAHVAATFLVSAADPFLPQAGGVYTISTGSGRVSDTTGNMVSAGQIGTLSLNFVDAAPPTVAVSPATIAANNASFTFTVIYSKFSGIDATTVDSQDITIIGPGGFSAPATLVSTALRLGSGRVDGVTAVYRVDGPAGGFIRPQSGDYAVSINANQIQDSAGNFVPAGSAAALTLDFPDTIAPTATASGGTIAAGSNSFTFSVAYHDETGIDLSSLDDNDLTVQAPGGESEIAHLVSTSGSATDVNATYRVDAVSAFFATNSGTFTVVENDGQVVDTSGNAVASGAIGSFELTFPALAPKADLMGTVKSVAPASLVAGGQGKMVLTVRNGGTAAMSGNATIKVYIATDEAGAHAAAPIGTLKTMLKLGIGRSTNVTIAFTAPANLTEGDYHLVAVLDSARQVSELNETNNTAVSTQSVHIAPKFVDLRAAFLGRVGPTILAKKANSVSLLVTNLGNTTASGGAIIRLFESADQNHSSDRLLATLPKTINLAPGKSVVIPLKFTPTSVSAGQEFLLAGVVYNGKPAEKNPGDNSVFSTTVVVFK